MHKVLGSRMMDMIDHALLNKARYDEWNTLPHASSEKNPWIKFKKADSSLGWREMCVWFTGLCELDRGTGKGNWGRCD
jgi:hypothetical protein